MESQKDYKQSLIENYEALIVLLEKLVQSPTLEEDTRRRMAQQVETARLALAEMQQWDEARFSDPQTMIEAESRVYQLNILALDGAIAAVRGFRQSSANGETEPCCE